MYAYVVCTPLLEYNQPSCREWLPCGQAGQALQGVQRLPRLCPGGGGEGPSPYDITLWTTYSTKPSSTVTKSYNTAPNEIIQERLKHNSLDHLQHQAKQYSNEVIQYRTERDHTGTAQT